MTGGARHCSVLVFPSVDGGNTKGGVLLEAVDDSVSSSSP